MGAENSVMIDEDTPPQTLRERSLEAVAEHIKDGKVKRIVVLTGAGLSTAAGIPDFRSPKTGLYHNLARLNLPHAEAVFEIDYFRENPYPFYILAKELYPGRFSPTISHVFIALLAKKNLLHMLFTQNIDCLERAAGVPPGLIVEAHGSFATQRCIDCKTPYPDKEMLEHVERGEPPKCQCGGLVKPDIVFFGEALPESFYQNRGQAATGDLMLILGTSLTVHPFASLPRMAMEPTPRVLFNKERVGDLGSKADDVLCLGGCDEGIRKLADMLGWRDELEKMWRDIVFKDLCGDNETERQLEGAQEVERDDENKGEPQLKRDVEMQAEMERLVQDMGAKLELSVGNNESSTFQTSAIGTTKREGLPGSADLEADNSTKDSQSDRRDDIPDNATPKNTTVPPSDSQGNGEELVRTTMAEIPTETTISDPDPEEDKKKTVNNP